ncbi:MAG: UvrD-helicase domain-containing protein [Nannocystaceae bacterium]
MFTASTYQQAIFQHLASPTHNTAVVMAGPGAGKTTTIVQGLVRGNVTGRVVAFNKNAAEALTEKLAAAGNDSEARTFHSAGLRLCRTACTQARVDNRKYMKIVRDLMGHKHPLRWEVSWNEVVRVVEWLQITLGVDVKIARDGVRLEATVQREQPAQFEAVLARFNIDASPRSIWELVRKVLRMAVATMHRSIAFIDMVWLPVVAGLRAEAPGLLVVDEAQDMSACTYALSQILAAGDPVVYVGDPNQAIFGFAGASGGMLQRIVTEHSARVLRLPVCYRCPTSHVAAANNVQGLPMPGAIECAPAATQGELGNVVDATFRTGAKDGDLVLCRYTAPLVRSCVAFLAAGVPAQVRGRKIGKGLAELARKIERATGSIRKGADWVAAREIEEDQAREDLFDRARAICAIADWADAKTAKEFAKAVDEMFPDDVRGVEHSTVHRAKGNEAHTVWILQPDALTATSEGEACCRYVALTRAKHALYFVRD